jgi:hypothetical protein
LDGFKPAAFSAAFVVVGFPGEAEEAWKFDGGVDADNMSFDCEGIDAHLLTLVH